MNKKNIKKMKKIFSFSNCMSLFAILLASINFIYDIKKDNNESHETLLFQTSTMNKGYDTFFSKAGMTDELYGFFTLKTEIIISNNSEKTVSITKTDPNLLLNGKNIMYSDFLKNLELPVNINSHESAKLFVDIRYPINKMVYNLLVEEIEENSYQPIEKLLRTAYKNQIDIFGNEINYYEYSPDTYIISIDPNLDVPKATLEFITSQNNVFECIVDGLL